MKPWNSAKDHHHKPQPFPLLPTGAREPQDPILAAEGKQTELQCGRTDGRTGQEKMSKMLIMGTTWPVTDVLLLGASPLSLTLSG